jgi:hypothetical protein
LLEPLPLFERGLHPQVCGARQNPFCERQDAFHVEFFDLGGVAVVGLDVDGALEEERLVQTVELFLDGLGRTLGNCDLIAEGRLPRLPAALIP